MTSEATIDNDARLETDANGAAPLAVELADWVLGELAALSVLPPEAKTLKS